MMASTSMSLAEFCHRDAPEYTGYPSMASTSKIHQSTQGMQRAESVPTESVNKQEEPGLERCCRRRLGVRHMAAKYAGKIPSSVLRTFYPQCIT